MCFVTGPSLLILYCFLSPTCSCSVLFFAPYHHASCVILYTDFPIPAMVLVDLRRMYKIIIIFLPSEVTAKDDARENNTAWAIIYTKGRSNKTRTIA